MKETQRWNRPDTGSCWPTKRLHIIRITALLVLALPLKIFAHGLPPVGDPAAAITNHFFNAEMDLTVKGTVKNKSGAPLANVNITVKETNKGVTTDQNGNFSIAADPGQVLVFSSVGFKSQEVKVTNETTLEIILEEDVNTMDDVVVIGYGAQKRVNVTGSVATVNFKDLENIPQANTLNILSGRMAGVSAVQPGGQPGSDESSILIRGAGTLNDASPLVIIDGAMATTRDLGNLTPQEIESISVLKDASSAAIYGSRGANGVILVSTKQPSNKKLRIAYNFFYGRQSATYLPKFVESWQWMTLNNIATRATNYAPRVIEDVRNGILTDSFSNTQWFDQVFRDAPMSNHSVSVSGGTSALSFQGNVGYLEQQGIMYGTSARRYTYRMNVRAAIAPILTAGFNTWGYIQKRMEPATAPNAIMNYTNMALPITPVHYSSGKWGVYHPAHPGGNDPARIVNNPLLFTEIGRNDVDDSKLNLQSYLELKPLRGLTARTMVTYGVNNMYGEDFMPTYSYSAFDDKPVLFNNRANLQNREDNIEQLQMQTTVNYTTKLAKVHELSALLGYEYNQYNGRYFLASGYDLPDNDLQVLDRAVSDYNIGGSKQQWRLQSWFGRVNYAFAKKYLLEANLRIDGSSRFSAGNKYGVFPSFSAGWVLTEEKFMEGLQDAGINLLKLRGGWGRVGNDRIGNYSSEQYLDLNSRYGIGGQILAGAAITAFGNNNLQWESTSTTNIGLDLGLMKNRLFINIDVFKRLTDNILYNLPVPPSFGSVTPSVQNVASVSNKGWELSATYKTVVGNVQINAGLNVSYVKNRVENLNTREAINGKFILREGEPINSFFGYVYDGLFRDSAELQMYPWYSVSGPKIGAMRFRDINKDGLINEADRTILGSANTPFTYGLTGGIAWKGVDFSFLLQGVEGKDMYIYDNGNRPGNAGNSNYWKEWWTNRYDPVENPNGQWPAMIRNSSEPAATSSFWLHDASYLRIKNIELGYSFPITLIKKAKLSSARIYVSGQNLFTFSSLIKQLDPERDNTTIVNTSYPQTKIITFGLNVSL
ncbi:MAG: TonB-dependent receptor [Sphingobacteriales bacterium]|nr:TonB-dependent receptor [Sphingobacteriales bacterium]OJV99460.1 MAG: hypothetical protein BGO52_12440 [Sphingobacteriales bacterium 44-61]